MKNFKKEISFIKFILYCSLSLIGWILFDVIKQRSIMSILDKFLYFIPNIVLISIIYYFVNEKSFKPIRQDKGIVILLINLAVLISLSAVFIGVFG